MSVAKRTLASRSEAPSFTARMSSNQCFVTAFTVSTYTYQSNPVNAHVTYFCDALRCQRVNRLGCRRSWLRRERGQIPRAIETFKLHDAPGHLLRRCHQRSEELFTEIVGKDGPTRQQVALLVTVCKNPNASQAELVAFTGIDKNTLTHMIGRLTERGLLERRKGEHDARTNLISADTGPRFACSKR